MREKIGRWLPVISLVTAMLLWSSSFIALKIAFKSYSPMIVIWGRMLVGSLCFLLFISRLRQVRFRREDLRYLLLMAVCEPCIYFIFEAKAIELTTASQAGMITAMLPLLVAIGATVFLKEKVSRQTLSGFVLAIIGVCILSVSGEKSESCPESPDGQFPGIPGDGHGHGLHHLPQTPECALFRPVSDGCPILGRGDLFCFFPHLAEHQSADGVRYAACHGGAVSRQLRDDWRLFPL